MPGDMTGVERGAWCPRLSCSSTGERQAPGRAEYMEVGCGHTMRSQGRGDAVRQWGAGCFCQGDKDTAVTFSWCIFWEPFWRFPQSVRIEPSVPGVTAYRAEAGNLQKPFESPASELAAAFPVVSGVLWSLGTGGALHEREE